MININNRYTAATPKINLAIASALEVFLPAKVSCFVSTTMRKALILSASILACSNMEVFTTDSMLFSISLMIDKEGDSSE
ncbi:MAG: Uncharacterised protein [Flavobacteriaceae bacterium]|nr:MAG: Uncharacterised protein [Flavobacteriaceae bacterium]